MFNLYQILKEGYIASTVSIEQFCYALTGKLRPAGDIIPIEWEANIDDFAVFLNLVYDKRRKPQSKICNIFNGTDPRFNKEDLSSRCTRVNEKEHLSFMNRIKKVLNS